MLELERKLVQLLSPSGEVMDGFQGELRNVLKGLKIHRKKLGLDTKIEGLRPQSYTEIAH